MISEETMNHGDMPLMEILKMNLIEKEARSGKTRLKVEKSVSNTDNINIQVKEENSKKKRVEISAIANQALHESQGVHKYLNYYVVTRDDDKTRICPCDPSEILDHVCKILGVTVVNIQHQLFIIPDDPNLSPIKITKPHQLFAHMERLLDKIIGWSQSPVCMSRERLLEHLMNYLPLYRGLSFTPEYPKREGIYYHCNFPEYKGRGFIDTFVDFFNPETAGDRGLIKALLLSIFWGGPYGKKPLFVIASKDKQGSGKTTVIQKIAKLFGIEVLDLEMDQLRDSNILANRLLSPDGRRKKIVLVDNVTSELKSSLLARYITSDFISGRALYEGEGTRPNDLIWAVTLNTDSLDSDMAQRAVCVNIKAPTSEQRCNWDECIDAFIAENRYNVIAECLHILESDPISVAVTSRWGMWETVILGRMGDEDVSSVQYLIAKRRNESDEENMEYLEVIDAIHEHVRKETPFPGSLSKELICERIKMAEIIRGANNQPHMKNTTAYKIVKTIMDKGMLPELSTTVMSGTRGYRWKSTESVPQATPVASIPTQVKGHTTGRDS